MDVKVIPENNSEREDGREVSEVKQQMKDSNKKTEIEIEEVMHRICMKPDLSDLSLR